MSELIAAGVCLVLAQIVGIYGLVTRKADLVLSLLMGTLVLIALLLGLYEVYHHLHS